MGDYCLKVGGLAWPFADKPGVAVVLGKDWDLDRTLHERRIWVLAVRIVGNLNDLSRHYHDLQTQFDIDDWRGDTSDRASINYLWDQAEKKRKSFFLGSASHCDDPKNLRVYLSMIQDLSRRTQKVLEYGESGSIFESYLNGLGPEDRTKPAEEHTPIAALAYALSGLKDYDPVDEDEQEPEWLHLGRSPITGY